MIAYKTASSDNDKKVLVTLKIPKDALTNINRDDIKDKRYAKYRCNKATVVSIEDNEGNFYNSALTNIYKQKSIEYVVGKEVVEKDYCKNIDVVCGEGIHFFLDKEVAIMYKSHYKENGEFKRWYGNGQLYKQYSISNGKFNGEYKEWLENGIINELCNYKEGELDGEYKTFHLNGKVFEHYNYKKGFLDGKTEIFDSKGNKCLISTYKNGKLDGKYQTWDGKGKMVKDEMYVNGEKIN